MWSSDSEEEGELVMFDGKADCPRERINFGFLHDRTFNERFRMSRERVDELVARIGPHIQHRTNKNQALSPIQQILVALHWLGNGGQYHAVASMHNVGKATVCRVLQSFVTAVCQLLFNEIIKFPENIGDVIKAFYGLAGFPQVVGTVDGILINIDSPVEYEEQFVDQHGNHSINCMAVCGPDLQFYSVSANWPGSVHDSRVLRNSPLCRRMDAGRRLSPNSVLLGDNGYPLKEWLMPPVAGNTELPGVQGYNRAHKSTRRVIECAFGVLKEKFPCLNHLRVNPVYAASIFKCCTVLHNWAKEEYLVPPEENAEADLAAYIAVDGEVFEVDEDGGFISAEEGARERQQQLINRFIG